MATLNTQKIKRFENLLKASLPKIADDLYKSFEKVLLANSNQNDSGIFNNTDKLRITKDGNTLRYIRQNLNPKVSNTGISFQIRPPDYIEKQEKGGTIKGTSAMQRFFWAKYFETSKIEYKMIALKIRKDGVLTLRKRPTVSKSIQEFRSKELPKIIKDIKKDIIKLWNSIN